MSNDNNDWGQGDSNQPGQQDDWGQTDQGWGQPDPQAGPAGQPTAPPQAEQRSVPSAGPEPGSNPGAPPQTNPNQGGGQMMKSSGKKKFPDLETNDIVILILSFLLPGVGHLMLGQTMKGLVILAAIIFTCGAGYIASILVVADAFFCLAKKKEYGQLEDWEVFPNYQDYV